MRKALDKEVEIKPEALPFAIDEAPEFHDPYSDLNIYLARKIKEEIKTSNKKWSVFAQERLIEKITPEFKKLFPHYRLGVAALKKIWEKVAYFSQAFENQKEALNSDGKLNIRYLIRENLKQFLGTKKSFSFHPYLLAQQLALKISECLATYDGTRPMLQHITKIIWAVERHLIAPADIPQAVNPYDEFDKWDKLIIKYMCEALGKNPDLSQEQLQEAVRYALHNFSLEQEIGYFLIDNPDLTPEAAHDTATTFLRKAQELTSSANWVEVEHKITFWTIQGDLVYRCLKIEKNPLLDLVCNNRTHEYPLNSEQVTCRINIFSRYAWYALLSSPTESSALRYMKWHLRDKNIDQLEEIWKKQLPMLPFDRKLAENLLPNHQINPE